MDEARKFPAETRTADYVRFLTDLYNEEAKNNPSLPRDRDEMTEAIQNRFADRSEGTPPYEPDLELLAKRGRMKERARRAVVEATLNRFVDPELVANLSKKGIVIPREEQVFFQLVRQHVRPKEPKKTEDGKEFENRLLDGRLLTDDFVAAARIFAEMKEPEESSYTDKALYQSDKEYYEEWKGNVYKLKNQMKEMAAEYLLEHAEEYEKLFEREMTDEELIERWPEIHVVLGAYGECEMFKNQGKPSQAHKMDQMTQGLIGGGAQLQLRMDYLSSDLCEWVDLEQLVNYGMTDAQGFVSSYDSGDQNVFDLNSMVGFIGANLINSYLIDAYRQLNVNPRPEAKEELIIQDTEGNILDQGSKELWDRMYVRQEPVYVVPKDDPGVTPVVVQPINKAGFAVAGEKALTAAIDPPKPMEKPNFIVSALDTVFSGISRIFGGDFRFESCRRYDDYLLRVEGQHKTEEKLEQAKQRYGELTGKEQLDKIKSKLYEFTKDTPETLKEKHERFTTRLERADREKEIQKEINRKETLIRNRTSPEKVKLPDNKQKTSEYRNYYKEVQAAMSAKPENRELLYKIALSDNMTKLFEVYKAEKAQLASEDPSARFSMENMLNKMRSIPETMKNMVDEKAVEKDAKEHPGAQKVKPNEAGGNDMNRQEEELIFP